MTKTTSYRIGASPKGSRFGEEEANAVRDMLLSDQHLADGAVCTRFEQELGEYLGAEHVVATSSCTMALELVTRYLAFSAEDTVIASPLTYQSTTASPLDQGCRIRWCDIDPDTLSMSPVHLSQLLDAEDSVGALYLTHYGGDAARISEICEIAAAHNVVVIEDCAHALGTTVNGQAAGTWGDFGCFSFHSLKNMSTLGTGGAIATSSEEAAKVLRELRHIAIHAELEPTANVFGPNSLARPLPVGEGHEGQAFSHKCTRVLRGGVNATMSDVAAAAGRIQLRKLPEFLAVRRTLANRFDAGLRDLPGIQVLPARPGVRHAHHLYTFLTEPELRDKVLRSLHEGGVEIVQRFFPLHLLPEYRLIGGRLGQCPVAERIWFSHLVNLPIHPWLTHVDVDLLLSLVENGVTRGRK